MRVPGWISQAFSLELRKLLSYRADFWVEFAGSLFVQMVIAYFLWRAIFDFRQIDSLGGYSFEGMMLYYLLVPLVEKITRGHELGFLSREIYDGSLTRYLVYPLGFFSYKYVAHLSVSALALGQLLLGLTAFLLAFGQPAEVSMGLGTLVLGLIAAAIASLLYFLMAACLELLAFWADNVWSLLVMLRFGIRLLGGGMIPLALFPEWSQPLLTALPFPYVLSFPIRTIMGDVPVSELLQGCGIMTAWIVVFVGLAQWLWRRGTLRYAGVGI